MAEQAVPNIIKLRAERILQKAISVAYKTDQPNILKCLVGDKVYYVDIVAKEEIPAWDFIKPKNEVVEKSPVFDAQITREKIAEPKPKADKSTTPKKATSTKKKK